MATYRIKYILAWVALGLFLLVLSGCIFQTKDEKVAGGAEDFPNTLALGKAAATHISDHPEWNQFSILPSTYPSFDSADALVVNPEPAALGKIGAVNASDYVIWDFSDTATQKIIRRYHGQESLTKVQRDTSLFQFISGAKDSASSIGIRLEISGVDSFKITGRVQTYRYENLDSLGGFDRGTFYESTKEGMNGLAKQRYMVLLPGLDGDFKNTADNRPVSFSFTKTWTTPGKGIDTLEAFAFKDADGDGLLWGAGDSGMVDFQQINSNPFTRPTVKKVTQKIRLMLFKDPSKSYPIRFEEDRFEMDGKRVAFKVKGSHADSAFYPGDSSKISIDISFPDGSNWVEKHSRYHVILGNKTNRYRDSQLLDYATEITWRNSELLFSRFSLKPDQPVLANELSITGDLDLEATFADGDEVKGIGKFQDKKIKAELVRRTKSGEEKRLKTEWDAQGKLISQILQK